MPKFTEIPSRASKYLQNGALLGGAAGALGGYFINDGTWKQRLKSALVGTLIGSGVGGTIGWGSAKIVDLKDKLNKVNTVLSKVTPKAEEATLQAANNIAAMSNGTSQSVSDAAPMATDMAIAATKGQGSRVETAASIIPQITSVTSFDPSIKKHDNYSILPKYKEYLNGLQPSPADNLADNSVTINHGGGRVTIINDKPNAESKPTTADSFVQQQFSAREKQLNRERDWLARNLDNLDKNNPSVFLNSYKAEKAKHDTRVANTETMINRVLSAVIPKNEDGSFKKLYGPRLPENSPVLSFDDPALSFDDPSQLITKSVISGPDKAILGLDKAVWPRGIENPYIRKADEVSERLVYDALPASLTKNPMWNRFENDFNTIGDVFTNAIPRYDNQGLAGAGTLIGDRANPHNEEFKEKYKAGVQQRYSNGSNYDFWGNERVDPAQYIAGLGDAMPAYDQSILDYEDSIFPKYRQGSTGNKFKSDSALKDFNKDVANYRSTHSIASTKKQELTKLLRALVSDKYNADKHEVDTEDRRRNQLPLFTPDNNFLSFHRLNPNSDSSAVQFTNGRVGTDMLSALTDELKPILSVSDNAENKLTTDFDYAMGDTIVRQDPPENPKSFGDRLTSYEKDYNNFITDAALSNPLYRRGILAKDLDELSTLRDQYSKRTNKDFTLIPAGMRDLNDSDKEAITRSVKSGITELYKTVGKQENGGKQVVVSLNTNLGTFGPMLVINNLPNNVDENKIKAYFKNLSNFNLLTSK